MPAKAIAAGRVMTQASAMERTVLHCRPEPLAAMVPATPLDNICVVETGRPYTSAAPIVRALLYAAMTTLNAGGSPLTDRTLC